MVRNCKMCEYYQCEEIGDSDFVTIYAKEPTCELYKDSDDDDNLIEDFDRDVERDCCSLDFFKVAEIDEEIGNLFGPMDWDEDKIMNKAYARFKEKYGNA